jgi:hypothetical protein
MEYWNGGGFSAWRNEKCVTFIHSRFRLGKANEGGPTKSVTVTMICVKMMGLGLLLWCGLEVSGDECCNHEIRILTELLWPTTTSFAPASLHLALSSVLSPLWGLTFCKIHKPP